MLARLAAGVCVLAADVAGDEAGVGVVVPQLLKAVQARAQMASQCLVRADRGAWSVVMIVTYFGLGFLWADMPAEIAWLRCHGARDGVLRRSRQRNPAASQALAARLPPRAGGAPAARTSSPPRKSSCSIGGPPQQAADLPPGSRIGLILLWDTRQCRAHDARADRAGA